MAVKVRSGDLDQLFLMPPSVKAWLPEDHLAFFVLDVVSELDLAAFYAAYRADGRGGSVTSTSPPAEQSSKLRSAIPTIPATAAA